MSRLRYTDLEPGQAAPKRQKLGLDLGDFGRGDDDKQHGANFGYRRKGQSSGVGPNGSTAGDAMVLGEVLKKQALGNTGVIHSTGRHDPTTKQSSINQTCVFSKTQYDMRAQTLPSDSLAPLGSRKDHQLYAGSWVYAEADSGASRANVRRGVGGFGEVEVTDCVNGLDRRSRLWFVGISNTQTDSTDPNARTDCATTNSGSVTGLNLGPCNLKAGQTAGFLQTPYTVNDHGVTKPGIRVDGISPGKFMPMIIPLDDVATPSVALRAIEAAIEAKWVGGTPAEFEDAWRTAREKMRTVVFNDSLQGTPMSANADMMPIDLYLAWQIAQQSTVATSDEIFQLIEDAQMVSVGEDKHSDLLVTKKEDWSSLSVEQKIKLAALRQAQCLINHRNWVTQHAIGKIMTNAPPGAQVDVMLGYFAF